jgi:hypothetical protein
LLPPFPGFRLSPTKKKTNAAFFGNSSEFLVTHIFKETLQLPSGKQNQGEESGKTKENKGKCSKRTLVLSPALKNF